MAVAAWKTKWRSRFRKSFGYTPDKWEREKFLRNCHIEGGCWVWKGASHYVISGNRYPPLRMGYVMFKGSLGDDEKVGAICGKVCCVPSHLVRFTETRT